MNLIVAVDKNWAIGHDNKLLVHIPEDMKFFRQTTTGKVVVMGQKTLEGFPGKVPLKDRTNIVLSDDSGFRVKDAIIVRSLDELVKELKNYPVEDVYIIGGASVYRQMLDFCEVAYVTKINYSYDADTWFPNLDEDPDWGITAESEEHTYFDLEYHFFKYEKKK